jgi:hypothetical protein
MSTDEMDESPLAGRAAESRQIRGSTAGGGGAAAAEGGQPAGEDENEDGEAEEVPDWLSFAKFAKCVC